MVEDAVPVARPSRGEQIAAILGPDIFRWAIAQLPEGVAIDAVRYRDLIDVSEDELFGFVLEHGFDRRVVSENAVDDDHICLVRSGDQWHVFYTERGTVSQEAWFDRRDDAVREIVRRLMRLARIVLNSRYWHAHDLPFPISEHDT